MICFKALMYFRPVDATVSFSIRPLRSSSCTPSVALGPTRRRRRNRTLHTSVAAAAACCKNRRLPRRRKNLFPVLGDRQRREIKREREREREAYHVLVSNFSSRGSDCGSESSRDWGKVVCVFS
jgi:hypothetical protein